MAQKSLFIENAVIISKLDELIARIEYEKTKASSNLNQFEAQNENIKALIKEISNLKEKNSKLEKENIRLLNNLKKEDRIKEEIFIIPEKIAKIVNLIEEEDKSGVDVWNELIETLINEIEETINLLKK